MIYMIYATSIPNGLYASPGRDATSLSKLDSRSTHAMCHVTSRDHQNLQVSLYRSAWSCKDPIKRGLRVPTSIVRVGKKGPRSHERCQMKNENARTGTRLTNEAERQWRSKSNAKNIADISTMSRHSRAYAQQRIEQYR